MSSQTILFCILVITAISYIFDQLLDYINLKAQRSDIPDDIAAFYDRDKYLKSLHYHRELTNFSFLTAAFSFLLSFGMLYAGGFGWVDAWLRPYFSHEITLALTFFAVIFLVTDVLTLPFQLYSTFVIEEKYGFNKTTFKTFLQDKVKGYLISALIGGVLLSVLIYLVQQIGPAFWIWFAVIASTFVLLMNMFYASL